MCFCTTIWRKIPGAEQLKCSATLRSASNLCIIFPGYGDLILCIFLIMFLEL